MASISTLEGVNPAPAPKVLVCLPSLPEDTLQSLLDELSSVFSPQQLAIASPDASEESDTGFAPFAARRLETPHSQTSWVLTAASYSAAAAQAQSVDAQIVALLSANAGALPSAAIYELTALVTQGADLALPTYALGPHDGLVNAALIYPLTRALFGAHISFPLALDAVMSRRMTERMASLAQRQAAASQPEALLWPVAEAAAAGFTVRQVNSGVPPPPPPEGLDFNALFTGVAGSLFTDIEARATFWQRARNFAGKQQIDTAAAPATTEPVQDEVSAMIESFRNAHANLREIWSLVLPPQSLLALKKLSLSDAAGFSMPPTLWARIVYDFVLAFHLRTLNRGHLLGALTPLYLGWAASALRSSAGEAPAAAYRDQTAVAFELEKPYLLSRWRWPDRFNP